MGAVRERGGMGKGASLPQGNPETATGKRGRIPRTGTREAGMGFNFFSREWRIIGNNSVLLLQTVKKKTYEIYLMECERAPGMPRQRV